MRKNHLTVSHPGQYVKDAIEYLGISVEEAAKKIKINENDLQSLMDEKLSISLDIAKKLSLFFDNSIDVWMNLQERYDSSI